MPILEAKALEKQYQLGEHKVNALNCVDFIVEKGEFVAIMGPSGAASLRCCTSWAGWTGPPMAR